MTSRKKIIIVFAVVAVLTIAAVALAVVLFIQKGFLNAQVSQVDIDETAPIEMSEFITEESEIGCPTFAFDYPEEWQAIDSTNANGVKVQIKGDDSVDIVFEAFHTGGAIGDYLGNRVTIKEVAPADLAAGASQYVPGYKCMVADVLISGVKLDTMHSGRSDSESSSNGAAFLAVVPDSWVGEWVDETASGVYGFDNGVGCSYIFAYPENTVEDPEHSNYGPLAVGFYCKNANLLSDEDREKVVATLSSLRVVQ